MKLIQPFAALINNGVTLTFKLAAAGEKIQLDILPSGKDSKTGVALPPKALVGTAEDLDANLEAYLEKYAASLSTIADVVAKADVDLEAAEKAASDTARKAVEEKRNKTKPGKSTPALSGPKKKDATTGLIDTDDDDAGETGGGEEDEQDATTLDTTGSAAAPAAAPAAAGAADQNALPAGLF